MESKAAQWIDKTTCILKVDGVAIALQVFANKQVIANVSDSDKFGSVFSVMPIQSNENQMDFDEFGVEEDLLDSQLLLGDRKSVERGDLFAQALYKVLIKKPAFSGISGMTLTVSLKAFREVDAKIAMT